MEYKTLREVCNLFHVSRRAVQGYEDKGLVAPSGKNEKGYLLYDTAAQERIRLIKMYQRFGFSLDEIGFLMKSSKETLRQSLEKQLIQLKKDLTEKEKLIEELERLIDTF